MTISIHPIEMQHQPFLWEMLFQAVYVEPGEEQPTREILQLPEIAHYAAEFGQLPGDKGVVAVENGQPVGAAWVRLIHGYGFVDDQTPELVVGVLPEYRGQGIGTLLMEHLLETIKPFFAQISLSVNWSNRARHLYEHLGFEVVRVEDGTATMIKRLTTA